MDRRSLMTQDTADAAHGQLVGLLMELKAEIRRNRTSRDDPYPECTCHELAGHTSGGLRSLVDMHREDLREIFGRRNRRGTSMYRIERRP